MPEPDPIPSDAQPSEAPEAVEIPENAKEHAPMLDVHPAHHAASTWREFFIHIATIVLGLLIAVSLEQLIEYLRHLRQVAETREVLRKEREEDRLGIAYTTAGFRLQAAELQNNLLILKYAKQHPGTPEEKLPGVMTWHYHMRNATRSGWLAAQQTGVTALMPRVEVARDEVLYDEFAHIDAAFDAFLKSRTNATRYMQGDPDITHMTPSQLEDELVLLEDAMQANRSLGQRLINLHSFAPDFDTISQDELNATGPATADAEKARLTAAKALTDARLAKAQAAFDEASKTFAQKAFQE
jgi:hypothetical protein